MFSPTLAEIVSGLKESALVVAGTLDEGEVIIQESAIFAGEK